MTGDIDAASPQGVAPAPGKRAGFLDLDFDRLAPAEADDWLRARDAMAPFAFVVTPNVDHLVRLKSADESVRRAYADADLCLCDSRVLARLAKTCGIDLPVVTGSDLVARLFDSVLVDGDRVAVIGSDGEAIDTLRRRFPSFDITHHEAPMGLRQDPSARKAVADAAVAAGARIILLAVGSPQQELIAQAMKAIPQARGTALCIGASIDFLTGAQQRAPVVVQRAGFEWAWRLATSPHRLFRRYLIEGPAIFRDGLGMAPEPETPMTAPERPIRIVHLAVDVNTPQRQRTTTAIEWFVDSLDAFENVLVGMRRTPLPWRTRLADCGADRGYRLFDLPFYGLPFGVGLLFSMWLVARRTIALLEREGLKPDLIHAHKLTFEGIAGWFVARHFGVPLFVSMRGEVETKIFRMKPTYRPLLRRICRAAGRLYFVSAWFRDEYHRHVPPQPDKERRLPNIVRNISPTILPQPAGDAFVTILNLDTWKRKGLPWLIDAFGRAHRQRPSLRMDVIGGGSADSVARATALIEAAGLTGVVRLTGPLPNKDVLERLPTYRGLLLPSRNETFGMVYVEALFAGIPILFTQGTAIDGYLDGLDVAVTVPEGNVAAIAAGILTLDEATDQMRRSLQDRAGELHARFDPDQMLAGYKADIRNAVTPAV